MFPSHSRRVYLHKASKRYLHNLLFLSHHTTFHPPSRMFYQLPISPNNKAVLFTRLQICKLTSGTTFSFAMRYWFNYWIFYKWDTCSMSSGMLFHIIWNIVPSYLEQHYILAVTRRFTLKHNERSEESSSQTLQNRKHEVRNCQLKIYA